MVCYKYLKENSQSDLQSAWFKWDYANNLLHHFLDQSTYYSVSEDGDKVYLTKSNVFDNDNEQDYFGILRVSYLH